jgi:hypothetical protein
MVFEEDALRRPRIIVAASVRRSWDVSIDVLGLFELGVRYDRAHGRSPLRGLHYTFNQELIFTDMTAFDQKLAKTVIR